MRAQSAEATNAQTRVLYTSSDAASNDAVFFRQVIEASATPFAVFQRKGNEQLVIYVNPAFERCVAYAAEDIVGRDWRVLWNAVSGDIEVLRASASIEAGEETRITLSRRASDGRTLWYELHVGASDNGNGPHHQQVAVLRDITAERSHLRELEHRAYTDALTGLPNRHLLQDRLKQALAHARRTGETFAVTLLDIDCFKHVNDTLGHDAGDALLQQIAGRLTRQLRQSDTVARLGGDEFVVILNPVDDAESANEVVSRLADEVQRPARIGGHDLIISCSIGISVYPVHGLDGAALLRNADQAMYHAKSRNRWRLPPSHPLQSAG